MIDLKQFRRRAKKARITTEYKDAASELQSLLRMKGFPDISSLTLYNRRWDGATGFTEGAIVEAGPAFAQHSKIVASSESLQLLTQDLNNEEEVQSLYQMMQIDFHLQELNISTYNTDIFGQAEHFTHLRCNSPSPLHLTLLDYLDDTLGRVTAQVTIDGDRDKGKGHALVNHNIGNQVSCTNGEKQDVDLDGEFLQWSYQLSDCAALFLDIATQHHPTVLTSLTLDITGLSNVGLASIQTVLCRSHLERLRVVCTPSSLDSLILSPRFLAPFSGPP